MAVQNEPRERKFFSIISLILLIVTAACYWQVGGFDFINLDDGLYVYQEPMVQQGFSWEAIKWTFHSISGGNWNPLIWFSHIADCVWFGVTPGGHHVVNLLLHLANVWLLFAIFKKMSGALWPSAMVAAIFAWHPQHVESVAWISERKDTLSTLFWLLTMWAYVEYVAATANPSARRKLWYGLALLFFTLGLMCKSMLVTLPIMLLLLDYWPLHRKGLGIFGTDWRAWKRPLLEKVPFIVLSLAVGLLTMWAQQSIGAMNKLGLPIRLQNAAVACIIYIEKFFVPTRMGMFYPFPHTVDVWLVIFSTAVIAAISAVTIWQWKKLPYLCIGWFWFLGTLLPVIGIIQVGMQARADRYTYIPYIGLAIMLAWGVASFIGKWPQIKFPLIALVVVGLSSLAMTTTRQAGYWKDNATLYNHSIDVTPGNYIAHSDLGAMYLTDGDLKNATLEFQEVIRLFPSAALPYLSLGTVYAMQNDLDKAIQMFGMATVLDPTLAPAHFNLGHAYELKGRVNEGIAEMKESIRLNPRDLESNKKLSDAFMRRGQFSDAVPYSRMAMTLQPNDARNQFVFAQACMMSHHPDEGVSHLKLAAKLAPESAECLNALAWVYATNPKPELRNGPEALRMALQAAKITKFRRLEILDTLAAAYAENGQFAEALKTNDRVIKMAEAAHDNKMVDAEKKRVSLYTDRKPYRDED